jgi:pyruvate ferredoxin oxidoreductase alpha subunit
MVVLDAFYLSHTYEPVDVPAVEAADRFLAPYAPRFRMDKTVACSFGSLVTPNDYMEMRHDMALAMEDALEELGRIEAAFAGVFERNHGAIEAIHCQDAEIVLVTSGTITSTARLVVKALRERGERVGLLKIRLFRPFPGALLREALKTAKKIAVIDRNCSFGAGGIFAQELKAALCNLDPCPHVYGYIAGIGGRDVTPGTIEDIYRRTQETDRPSDDGLWIGLREEAPHGC